MPCGDKGERIKENEKGGDSRCRFGDKGEKKIEEKEKRTDSRDKGEM